MPTNIAVTIFKPIWKFHTAPIKFIININSPPKTEFIINLNNAFNGTENIFPIIHKTIIHPKITKALEKSNFYHHSFSNMYDKNWTNITYPTWFFWNIFLLSCLEIILLILLYLLKSQLYFCLLLFDMCNNLLNLLLLFQNFYLLNLNLFLHLSN